jgi:hypothetical protein
MSVPPTEHAADQRVDFRFRVSRHVLPAGPITMEPTHPSGERALEPSRTRASRIRRRTPPRTAAYGGFSRSMTPGLLPTPGLLGACSRARQVRGCATLCGNDRRRLPARAVRAACAGRAASLTSVLASLRAAVGGASWDGLRGCRELGALDETLRPMDAEGAQTMGGASRLAFEARVEWLPATRIPKRQPAPGPLASHEVEAELRERVHLSDLLGAMARVDARGSAWCGALDG